jgi:hypothetical protein
MITGKNADAPTTARLKIAPSKIAIILSSGVLNPNERLPEMRISAKAIKNTTMPLHDICRQLRSFPSPKIVYKRFMLLKSIVL